jgi:hypothetical protein
MLVLLPFESNFTSLSRRRNVSEAAIHLNGSSPSLDAELAALNQCVSDGHVVLTPLAESACQSFVAHYMEHAKHGNTSQIIRAADELAESFGLVGFPPFRAHNR